MADVDEASRKKHAFREQLYFHIESAPGRHLSILNRIIIAAIIASVGIGIVGTEPAVREALGNALPMMELALGSLFLAELAARLWCCGVDPRYSGYRGRIRYLRRPLALIDLIVIATMFAPFMGGEAAALRLIRLLRLVALAKFGRYSDAMHRLITAVAYRGHELILSVAIAGVALLISASGMYVLEGETQPEAFGSIPRALWWSMATLTTVGYGDVYPVTPLGKMFAGLTAVAGIAMIAMPTGVIASAFSEIGRAKPD